MAFTEIVGQSSETKRRRRAQKTIEFVEPDVLCMIFAFLDLFDLVRCTVVCKCWNATIKRYKLLQALGHRMQRGDLASSASTTLQRPEEIDLVELAMKQHKLSLLRGQIDVDRWKDQSARVAECRLKMGLLLTGVGDKVMRLWSLNSYKCLEEYSIGDSDPLVDFDFDESKVVGLVGTQISIWRRNGDRSIFPSRKGMFPRGLCMRYMDPEAAVGCEDGTVRVFDMYSRKCSRIIRTHAGSLTCLCLSEDLLLFSGSSLGKVIVSDPLSDYQVATLKSMNSTGGIKTLCFNPSSFQVFSGSTAGYVSCWDLRKMGQLWENRASPNVVHSLQHLTNDTSVIASGGIDGVLRIMDQNTGKILSSCVMDDHRRSPSPHLVRNDGVVIEKRKGRRLSGDFHMDGIDRRSRPIITCLAVGMKKVVTTHGDNHISLWRFNKL